MQRDYSDGVKTDVTFFTGHEVEHTPMKGAHTLFVVGLQAADAVDAMAQSRVCKHVYLGANQSFAVKGYDDYLAWQAWDQLCMSLLDRGYWVTLDFDVQHWAGVVEMSAMSHAQFIPQISVKIPYASLGNYNTCVKIDDMGFCASNPGVWVHSLHDLMDRRHFTAWAAYKQDQQL
jgi:hypothetical protein